MDHHDRERHGVRGGIGHRTARVPSPDSNLPMRLNLERGSGTLTTVAGIGTVIAVTCGALVGVDAVMRMTAALRAAEGEAVRLAVILSEGVGNPCDRTAQFVTECQRLADSVRLIVTIDGVRATATAGPC